MNQINKKMSLLEKISYGSGNMGICLCTTLITTFIMYFYTDVVKISVLQVGTIMLIGGIADAVSDAVMGIIVDHTNTRWGKCRPYLIFGAIPMAAACFFVLHVPDASATVKYIYALITYVIYTLAYTTVLIPQNVLISAITDDTQDRLATNMFGTLGTNIAQVVVKSSTTVYYSTNVLQNAGMSSSLLSVANIIGIPITLIIPVIAAKIGNRNIVWVGSVFGVLGNIGIYFLKFNNIAVIACAVIASVGTAFVNGIIYVMCAESIDYGEWKSGIRVQGFLMAFIGFAVKIANSIVQMITTAILNAGGYNGAAEVQTASAVNAIEFCYVWIPVILFVIVFIINGFYKLDKIYPQIRADLNKKRDAMVTEN